MWGILRIFAAREVWAARPDPTKPLETLTLKSRSQIWVLLGVVFCIPYAIVGSRFQLLIYLIFFADILQECDVSSKVASSISLGNHYYINLSDD